MRRTIACLLFVAACGDPANWRARDARAYPATKAAYRVEQADEACDRIGVVHAKGSNVIEDIAETAARHGGTHYVIRDDRHSYSLETRQSATAITPTWAVARSSTTVVDDRATWAEVYRCP
jgi:ABC-type uncharacterized transport system ATPase subunit